ncbi:MAG TPA: hypothetical protein VJ729_12715 [Nitrososphaeraceae archaeon]|nr:hypothetical protein [Nitrososphaeraceae archaeon]
MKYKNHVYFTCLAIFAAILILPFQNFSLKVYGQTAGAAHFNPGGSDTHTKGNHNSGNDNNSKKGKSDSKNSDDAFSSTSDSSPSGKGGITSLIACIKEQASSKNGQIARNDLDNCYFSIYGFDTTASLNGTKSLSSGFG